MSAAYNKEGPDGTPDWYIGNTRRAFSERMYDLALHPTPHVKLGVHRRQGGVGGLLHAVFSMPDRAGLRLGGLGFGTQRALFPHESNSSASFMTEDLPTRRKSGRQQSSCQYRG